ncbi:MAG: FxsA family protein [Proteobacteria bacterium]|nr:FxsA family protein [Pseudomonadota bacterium]MCL2307589.1 FxsA family protein [Pseudomonadota bacterium]
MPFILLLWLLLPWFLDLWLTFVVARAVGVSVWLFFLVSAALGVGLLVWEWRRVQAYWKALRRLEGSPWQLLASVRRGLAAVLLILPGLGSSVLALLLLCLGGRRGSVQYASGGNSGGSSDNNNGRTAGTAYRAPPGVIEGEFRREE